MMCGLAVLAKGLRRAGAAGDRVRGLPGLHLELAAAAAGAAPLGLLLCPLVAAGGGGALAPRHVHPPRRRLLERAVRRQPLAPDGDRAATATAAPSSTSCASWATACCPGWRWPRRPWAAGAAPCGGWRRRRGERGRGREAASTGWARSGSWPAYAVVSKSMTKFHHYILPAIPGLAIVIGCFLDELCERRDWRRRRGGGADRAAAAAAGGADLVNTKNASQRFLWLFSYDYIHSPRGRPWPDQLDFTGALIVFAVRSRSRRRRWSFRASGRWAAVGLSAGGGRVHLVPAGRLHARGGAVLVAEGADRGLLQAPALARGAAGRLPDVLARRDLLHEERDLRGPAGGADGVRHGRRRREAEGLDLAAPRGAAFFMFERGQQARLQSLLPAETRGRSRSSTTRTTSSPWRRLICDGRGCGGR